MQLPAYWDDLGEQYRGHWPNATLANFIPNLYNQHHIHIHQQLQRTQKPPLNESKWPMNMPQYSWTCHETWHHQPNQTNHLRPKDPTSAIDHERENQKGFYDGLWRPSKYDPWLWQCLNQISNPSQACGRAWRHASALLRSTLRWAKRLMEKRDMFSATSFFTSPFVFEAVPLLLLRFRSLQVPAKNFKTQEKPGSYVDFPIFGTHEISQTQIIRKKEDISTKTSHPPSSFSLCEGCSDGGFLRHHENLEKIQPWLQPWSKSAWKKLQGA